MQGFVECRGCRRELKDDASRARGYGPVCWRRRNGPTRRRSIRPAPVPHAPDALPGQTQLDLFFHQPTLDSI
jgi:hypothetical protein